jgi:iron complex transport system substrate-binding protein
MSMKHQLIKLLGLAAFTSLVAVACQETTDHPVVQPSVTSVNCRIIEHEVGETEICGQPQRIVVLGPSVLESLLALDVQPTGFADYTTWHRGNYDNPSQQIPYLGSRITSEPANLGSAFEPSIEAIVEVQPDLILGTQYNASQYEVLSKIAPTLLLSRNDDEIEASLRAVAKAVGKSEQAEELLAKTEQRIASARETFAPVVAAHPKMLLLGAVKWQELYLGDSNYGLCSSLIEELDFQLVTPPGLENSQADTPIPISHETLTQLNEADSVMMFTGNLDEFESNDSFESSQVDHIKQAWSGSAIAQSLEASKAGRVYFIPGYLCRGLPGAIGTELYLKELKAQLLSLD